MQIVETVVTLFLVALGLFVVGFLKISREEAKRKESWVEPNELKQAQNQFFNSLKTEKRSIWTRIRLLFAKKHCFVDQANGKDKTCSVTVKKIGKDIYIEDVNCK